MHSLHVAGAAPLLWSSSDLRKVDCDNKNYLKLMADKKQYSSLSMHKCLVQCVSNLLGESDCSYVLTGRHMVEKNEIQKISGEQANGSTLAMIRVWKGLLCCLFRKFKSAEETLDLIDTRFVFVITRSFVWYYSGLACLFLARHRKGRQRRKRIRKGYQRVVWLRKVARYNPFLMHRVYMLEALLFLTRGQSELAFVKFEASIEWAKKFESPCDEAVACEHFGISLCELDRETEGRRYLKNALNLFDRWGAKAKVDHLVPLVEDASAGGFE